MILLEKKNHILDCAASVTITFPKIIVLNGATSELSYNFFLQYLSNYSACIYRISVLKMNIYYFSILHCAV